MKTRENRISTVKSGMIFETLYFFSDPKTGNAESLSTLFNLQGDAICINNFMRLLKNVN
jgi:hypothetical protein